MKLKVITYDEVYHPIVSFLRPEITEENTLVPITEEVKLGVVEEYAQKPAEEKPTEQSLVDVIEKIEKPMKRKNGWKLFRSRFATILVVLIVIVAAALVGLRLAGFRTFTVMSGSMQSEYPVGSLIYVKSVDYTTLNVGDVISYVANDDKTVVTHRITEIEVDKNDASVWRFQTKGDANASADGKLVHYKNVLGTPIIVIPYIGYFAHNVQQPPGIYITLVVGTLLLAWTFLPGTLEERRKTARKSMIAK